LRAQYREGLTSLVSTSSLTSYLRGMLARAP